MAETPTTSGSLTSKRHLPVSARRDVLHPSDARVLADAILWACEESDRLAERVNAAGLAISKVEVRLPTTYEHFVRVMVAGESA